MQRVHGKYKQSMLVIAFKGLVVSNLLSFLARVYCVGFRQVKTTWKDLFLTSSCIKSTSSRRSIRCGYVNYFDNHFKLYFQQSKLAISFKGLLSRNLLSFHARV